MQGGNCAQCGLSLRLCPTDSRNIAALNCQSLVLCKGNGVKLNPVHVLPSLNATGLASRSFPGFSRTVELASAKRVLTIAEQLEADIKAVASLDDVGKAPVRAAKRAHNEQPGEHLHPNVLLSLSVVAHHRVPKCSVNCSYSDS
eukprot:122542-Amphidinium_carterae.2